MALTTTLSLSINSQIASLPNNWVYFLPELPKVKPILFDVINSVILTPIKICLDALWSEAAKNEGFDGDWATYNLINSQKPRQPKTVSIKPKKDKDNTENGLSYLQKQAIIQQFSMQTGFDLWNKTKSEIDLIIQSSNQYKSMESLKRQKHSASEILKAIFGLDKISFYLEGPTKPTYHFTDFDLALFFIHRMGCYKIKRLNNIDKDKPAIEFPHNLVHEAIYGHLSNEERQEWVNLVKIKTGTDLFGIGKDKFIAKIPTIKISEPIEFSPGFVVKTNDELATVLISRRLWDTQATLDVTKEYILEILKQNEYTWPESINIQLGLKSLPSTISAALTLLEVEDKIKLVNGALTLA